MLGTSCSVSCSVRGGSLRPQISSIRLRPVASP